LHILALFANFKPNMDDTAVQYNVTSADYETVCFWLYCNSVKVANFEF
jgi:hypothetical protein